MRKRTIKFLALLLLGLPTVFLSIGRPQPLPAPEVDRVGFPRGYQDNYKLLFVFDRPDNRQVRVIYGNDNAASMQLGEPLPYGSILVMETYRALVKDDRVVLDEKGRFQRMGDPTGVFVMRKEMGFGEAYQQNRTGEWEYVAYKPDGSYLTAGGPRDSGACAQCHLQATSAKDWVFRASLYLDQASGALPNGLMQHYLFLPGTITAQAGVPVTWYNDDEVDHHIVLDAGGFDSGNLSQGTSTSYTFDKPGEYDYHCTIHSAMKGKVVVKGDK